MADAVCEMEHLVIACGVLLGKRIGLLQKRRKPALNELRHRDVAREERWVGSITHRASVHASSLGL